MPIKYYEAFIKNGCWEGNTLSQLQASIVNYYTEDGGYMHASCPSVDSITLHTQEQEIILTSLEVCTFNSELQNLFDETVSNIIADVRHEQGSSSPYLSGRI